MDSRCTRTKLLPQGQDAPPNLFDFPDEILLPILCATPGVQVARLLATCRRFATLADYAPLWHALLRRDVNAEVVETALCRHATTHFSVRWCHVYAMLVRDSVGPGWGHRYEEQKSRVRMGHFDDQDRFDGFGAVFSFDPGSRYSEAYASYRAGVPEPLVPAMVYGRANTFYKGAVDGQLLPHGEGSLTQGQTTTTTGTSHRGSPVGRAQRRVTGGPTVALLGGEQEQVKMPGSVVVWPEDHPLYRAYDGAWTLREPSLWPGGKPNDFGRLTLATGEHVSTFFFKERCHGLTIVDHPASGFTRFLFPLTGSDNPVRREVWVDRDGGIRLLDAGVLKENGRGFEACVAISSWSVSPTRIQYSIHGRVSLPRHYSPVVGDATLVESAMSSVADRHARHLPALPVGSITCDGREEMVFYFAYDMIVACADLKARRARNLQLRVLPSSAALAAEARRSARMRVVCAPVSCAPQTAAQLDTMDDDYAGYCSRSRLLCAEVNAWRLAMSQHANPATVRVISALGIYGEAGAGQPRLIANKQIWMDFVERADDNIQEPMGDLPLPHSLRRSDVDSEDDDDDAVITDDEDALE